MGPEETKYLQWQADHPEIMSVHYDINWEGFANHLDGVYTRTDMGRESIDWIDSTSTEEERREFLFEIYNKAQEAIDKGEPFEFNDRRQSFPKSKQPKVDLKEWLAQRELDNISKRDTIAIVNQNEIQKELINTL